MTISQQLATCSYGIYFINMIVLYLKLSNANSKDRFFLFKKAVKLICCIILIFALCTADRTLCFIWNLPLELLTAIKIKSMLHFYKQNLWTIKILNVQFFFYETYFLKDFCVEKEAMYWTRFDWLVKSFFNDLLKFDKSIWCCLIQICNQQLCFLLLTYILRSDIYM